MTHERQPPLDRQPPLAAGAWSLARNRHGRLMLTDASGESHDDVVPVRAFPLSAPDEGVSLVGADGHERLWVEHLADAPGRARALIAEELAAREFMPAIRRIVSVSTFATPSTWTVETDRGTTSFVLKGEEDIRRLAAGRLLVADSHGLQFEIVDRQALDRHSRRLLERFL